MSAARQSLRVLIIDDSSADRAVYRTFLGDLAEFDVTFVDADCGEEGIRIAAAGEEFDCLLLDSHLPDMTGLEVLQALERPPAPVIMLTEEGVDEEFGAQAARHCVSDVMPKQRLSRNALHRSLSNAIEKNRLRRSLESSTSELRRTAKKLRSRDAEVRCLYRSVSHDLTTPLTAVQALITLVLDGSAGDVSATQREYLDAAQLACLRLRRYADDLLDFMRSENDELSVEMTPGCVARVAEETVRELQGRVDRKGLRLRFQTDGDIPEVCFDPGRLRQILLNLIDDALGLSDHGSVTVSVTASGDAVCLAVSGPSTRRELGLHVCQALVDLHGGTLTVERGPGLVSTARVLLPLASAAAVAGC